MQLPIAIICFTSTHLLVWSTPLLKDAFITTQFNQNRIPPLITEMKVLSIYNVLPLTSSVHNQNTDNQTEPFGKLKPNQVKFKSECQANLNVKYPDPINKFLINLHFLSICTVCSHNSILKEPRVSDILQYYTTCHTSVYNFHFHRLIMDVHFFGKSIIQQT